MAISDSYGERFGKRLGAQATSFTTRAMPGDNMIAVTELRYESPQFILSTPPVIEDAFVIGVHLKTFENYQYWENGKAAPPSTLEAGQAIIYDLKRKPTFHLNHTFHSVHFYLPMRALDAIADEAEAARIQELRYKPAVAHTDPTLHGMARALLPMFQAPGRSSRLFVEHAMLAVGHHAAETYGGMAPLRQPVAGGLTPSQERRAKELIASNLSGGVGLADLARECGLSPSHFARAFRQTVGVSPHKWVVQQRIVRARELLRGTAMSLEEVASVCGFFDQSHFTRSFSAHVGTSPGVWRRMIQA